MKYLIDKKTLIYKNASQNNIINATLKTYNQSNSDINYHACFLTKISSRRIVLLMYFIHVTCQHATLLRESKLKKMIHIKKILLVVE